MAAVDLDAPLHSLLTISSASARPHTPRLALLQICASSTSARSTSATADDADAAANHMAAADPDAPLHPLLTNSSALCLIVFCRHPSGPSAAHLCIWCSTSTAAGKSASYPKRLEPNLLQHALKRHDLPQMMGRCYARNPIRFECVLF
ncbi:hypothetical protein PVAP13_1NG213400 [Panicum virgatum]|uniref:Uncharacterized protein n=1 Tax=Panicum virgatum TaxID=38727 RepID=A0A8T0X5W5_PANVG|nr:hypothetical protein PVAP13_1NG213400 [Panicum virgatum]